MVKIKFVYDIASPNGYLCHKVIPDFEAKHSVKFDYFICLLGGIHKLSNNTPPMVAYAEIPNKNSYFSKEIERFAKFHKIENYVQGKKTDDDPFNQEKCIVLSHSVS